MFALKVSRWWVRSSSVMGESLIGKEASVLAVEL
jgi:hypothetical protein